MWPTLRLDICHAFRSMSRQPVFTLVIVATLALGIGANTAVFALIHAALLKPGISMSAAQSQVDVVSRRLQQQYPATNKVKGLRLDPLQSALLQPRKPRLMVLMGAVGFVLLLAVAFTASAWPAWRAGHIDPMQALRGK
jgi:ABC-type antimicrobial peptide transport system permease subunit